MLDSCYNAVMTVAMSTAGLLVKMTTMQPCTMVSCTCAAKVKVAHVLQVADVEVLLVGLLILIDPLHMQCQYC